MRALAFPGDKAPGHERVIQAPLWAIKPLADSGGPIPFPYMLTFLTVPVEEGKSVGAYARELNVDRFPMSRQIRCIGDRRATVGPASGLSPQDESTTTRREPR